MSSVTRHAALVGAMTGISRLAGLVREQMMAYMFGTGLAKSAFDVAFRIPNLFRRLFGEGALSAAFIPVFTEVRAREGAESANRLAAKVAGLLITTLGIITALGILLTAGIEAHLTPGSRWIAIMPLLRIMLPYAPLICLAALIMGILNALKHFTIPALAPVFLNLVWMAALVGICPFVSDDSFVRIRVVAWAVVVAGVVQVAVQLPALARRGVLLRLDFHWFGEPRIGHILRLMAPMALGAGLVQINVCIDGILAMWAADWAPSSLEYAERLVYLPLGLIGNAFATVLLPTLATHAADRDYDGFRTTLSRSLGNMIILMAPAALGLTVLSLPVVTLVYRLGDGAFQATDALRTARALAGYAPGLLVFSLYKSITPAFFAMQDTRTPVRVGIFSVCLNLAMNITAVMTLPADWKHVGIAVSTVLTSLINCVVLGIIIQRRTGGTAHGGGLRRCTTAALAAATIMAVVVHWLHGFSLNALDALIPLKLAQLGAVMGTVAVGALLYTGLMRLFDPQSLAALVSDFRRRKSPKRVN